MSNHLYETQDFYLNNIFDPSMPSLWATFDEINTISQNEKIQFENDNEQNLNIDSNLQISFNEKTQGNRTTFTREQRLVLEKGLLL
jgi:hypothetical protein